MFGKQVVICTVVLLVAALCVGCDGGTNGGVSLMPPTITTHPSSQTVTEGETASFAVAATGSEPLSYQWYGDTVAIPGATLPSYTTPATVFADDGAQFICVVTNAAGSDTPNPATLTVTPLPPSITVRPADVTVTEGQAATFTVTAAGSGTLLYQWEKNGANVTGGTGGTTASYTTPATVYGDNGAAFTCVVTNAGGSVTSNAATLTVTPLPPVVTVHPTDLTVTEGDRATFTVTATGSGTLTYQWKKDGVDVTGGTGGTTPSYTTPPTVIADSDATFTCVVTNEGGDATSNPPVLTVNMAPYRIVDLTTGVVTYSQIISDLDTNDAYKTTHLVLKRIEAGSFEMGDQVGGHGADELPVHTVGITQAFYMGVFEVTQKQWNLVEGNWPSEWRLNPDKRPVEMVSWDDIKVSGGFMDTLSSLASMSFRLPTEAEWEYSCKAGTSTNYSYGDTENGAWMWYDFNSDTGNGSQTHEVATTTSKPNPWGLYDMHGNVLEWCEDWYDATYYDVSPTDDPQGPASGDWHIFRGGSWKQAGDLCRSPLRLKGVPIGKNDCIGFRVVVTEP